MTLEQDPCRDLAAEEPPPLTIIRLGYEIAGVPQFLEIRASHEIDARALCRWLEAQARAPGPERRMVEIVTMAP